MNTHDIDHVMNQVESYEVWHRLPNYYWAMASDIIVDIDSGVVKIRGRKKIPLVDAQVIVRWVKNMAAGLRNSRLRESISLFHLCECIANKVHEEMIRVELGTERDEYPRIREWLIWQIGDAVNSRN